MLVNPVHPEKAPEPMLVTLFGISMLVNAVQPLKVSLPILVTLSGMMTFSRESLHTTMSDVTELEPLAITSSLIGQ